MKLTQTHLTAINHHLRRDNWLLNEALIAELIDHYTNAVEERMTAGLTFEQAVRAVHAGFGGQPGLLQMEEQYVKQLNRAAWLTFQKTFRNWFTGPRVVAVPLILALFYWLLDNYGQDGALLMALLFLLPFVGVCFYLNRAHDIQVWRRWNGETQRKHVLAGQRYVSLTVVQWSGMVMSILYYPSVWWHNLAVSVHHSLWVLSFSVVHVLCFLALASAVEVGRPESRQTAA
ncbi:hypothetical protein [Tellurirhabdus rosea]|uniref:hypothetical protein n=1 Tax=Tellurirhabdus rosea TaxID=2674997 RepID=UPI00225B197E|nr:hypothetical protein [Tellurirhabdus rosea]